MLIRAQAALEYLITYGTAALIVFGVIAGIWQLDPLDQGSELRTCRTSDDRVKCNRDYFKASEDAVELRIANNEDTSQVIDNITVTEMNGENVSIGCQQTDTIVERREQIILTCPVDIAPEQTNQLTISYNKQEAGIGSSFSTTETMDVAIEAGDAINPRHTITGEVIANDTKAGLQGLTVDIMSPSRSVLYAATTASDGSFETRGRFEDLPEVILETVAPGFYEKNVTQRLDDIRENRTITLIPVVYDLPTNSSVENTTILVKHDGTQLNQTSTGPDRYVEFTYTLRDDVYDGDTVRLEASKDEYGTETEQILLDKDNTVTPVFFNMSFLQFLVNGTVKSTSGTTISDADITVLDEADDIFLTDNTTSQGTFNYQISANSSFDGRIATITTDKDGYDNQTVTTNISNSPNITITNNLIQYAYNTTVLDQNNNGLQAAALTLQDGSHATETNTTGPLGTATLIGSTETGISEDQTVRILAERPNYTTNDLYVNASPTTRTKNKTISLRETRLRYDFEDNTLQGWQPTNSALTTTDSPSLGDHAASLKASSAPRSIGYVSPVELTGGSRIDSLTFSYQEQISSHGGGLSIEDSNGDEILGIATDNPQWLVRRDSGWTTVYSGDGYDRWVNVSIDFDWDAGTADITFHDTASGTTRTTTEDLRYNTDVQTLRFKNQNVGAWVGNDDFHMQFDNIVVNGFADPYNQYRVQGATKSSTGASIDNAIITLDDTAGPYDYTYSNQDGYFGFILNQSTFNGTTGTFEAEQMGYENATTTTDVTGEPTVNLTQQLITYTYNANVEDTDTGASLDNAYLVLDDGSHASESGTTDSNGDTTLTGSIETGITEDETLGITANRNDYTATTKSVTADPDNRVTSPIIQLDEKQYFLNGNITADTGTPLDGATITVDDTSTEYTTTQTDGSANYQVTVNATHFDGDIGTVTADHPGYDPASQTENITDSPAIEPTPTVITYTYDVTVEDPNGLNVQNADLTLDDGAQSQETDTTASDGAGVVTGTIETDISEGETVSLAANHPEHTGETTTVTADPTNRGKTVSFILNTNYSVSGTITGSLGLQLDGASVTIDDNDGQYSDTTTDGSGNYAFTVDAAAFDGTQGTVTANTYGYDPASTTVNVTQDPTAAPTPQIIEYTYDVTVEAPDTTPIQDADVALDGGTAGSETGTTDSNGQTTVFGHLETGIQENENTQIAVTGVDAQGYQTKTVDVTASTSDRDKSPTITLQPKTYTVSGTVKAADGATLSGADVTIADNDGTYKTTTTDSNGDYSFTVKDPDFNGDQASITASQPEYQDNTITSDVTTNPDDTITLQPVQHTVSGTVTADTGTDLNSASVTLQDSNGDFASTTTDSNGLYSFTVDAPEFAGDTATVTADKTGYDAGSASGTLSNDPTLNPTPQVITYTWNVNVKDYEGDEVGDLDTVELHDASHASETDSGGSSATVSTNIEKGVSPGENINLYANEFEYNANSKTVTADPSDRTKSTTVYLSEVTYSVSGTVTDENSNALSNADVSIDDSNGNYKSTTTDSNGQYSFTIEAPDFAGSNGDITANEYEYNANTKSADVTSNPTVDFSLNPVTYTVDGYVTADTGTDLSGANVVLKDNNGNYASTTPDSNGYYSFNVQAPHFAGDTATVRANEYGYDPDSNSGTLSNNPRVDLTPQVITYTWNVNVKDYEGDEVGDLDTVRLDDGSHGSETDSGGSSATVSTNIEKGVNPGDSISLYANEWEYNANSKTVTADTGDRTKSTTVYLSEVTYSVSGTVTDENSNALSNADVSIDDSNGNYASTTTNSNGDYSFTVEAPDFAGSTVDVTANEYEYNANTKSADATSNPTVDFSLNPVTYSVDGYVTSSTGKDLSGASVTLQDSNGNYASTTPDSNGYYSFSVQAPHFAGDTATVTANEYGYDADSNSGTLSNNPRIDLTPNTITYTWNVHVQRSDTGASLNNAYVQLENGGAGSETASTDSNGDATVSTNIEKGVSPGENINLYANENEYNSNTNGVTASTSDRTKSETINLAPQTTSLSVNVNNDYWSTPTVTVDDDNGQYKSTSSSSPTFTIKQPDFAGSQADITASGQYYSDTAWNVDITSDNSVTINLPLPTYTWDFHVTSSDDSNDISGATVEIDDGSPSSETGSTATDGTVQVSSDRNGGVQDGSSYGYSITHPDYQLTTGSITANVDNRNKNPSVQLTPKEHTLSGKVTNECGNGEYAGITFDFDNGHTVSTETMADGTYSVTVKDDEIGDGQGTATASEIAGSSDSSTRSIDVPSTTTYDFYLSNTGCGDGGGSCSVCIA